MVRKGQMHVMDAIAAVMILFFFAISGFDTTGGNDWQSFENQISATDISYTLKQTGHLEHMVKNGESGSVQGAANGITQREFSISGQIQGVAPNLDLGFYRRPQDVKKATLDEVVATDNCYSDVQNDIDPKVRGEVLKTNASTLLNQNSDITLYLGDYEPENIGSEIDYDSIWIDRNNNCNFDNLDDPVNMDEIFEWGSDNHYEFEKVDFDNTDSPWTGELFLAEADQMKRFQETMNKEVNGVNNRVKINSFTLQSNTEDMDFLIFPEKESVERIEDQDQVDWVNTRIDRKPVLFLANLNQSLVENTFLGDNGFSWKDLDYIDQTGSCGTTAQEIIPCGSIEVGFSSTKESQNTRKMIIGQETDFSDISLYPEGSVTTEEKGALSFDKTMYLENFAYDKISEDRVNKGLTDHSVPSGSRPSTSCNNVTTGSLDFPDKNGSIETYDVVNTQLGNTASYCSQNNRALYIDKDQDGDYSEEEEGPYQDGEKADIRGLTYTTTILPSTASGCGADDCAGFTLDENAQVNIFTHNLDANLGRAPYEETYSDSDRKALAAFIYTMGGPTRISGDFESQVSTSIYGSTNRETFRVNLRWDN